MHRSRFPLSLLLCALAGLALAQPAPQGDTRKPARAFGGSVIVTPDEDWQAKWQRQGGADSRISEAGTVPRGKKLAVLIFFVNPAVDSRGQARIACDLRFLQPDGKVAYEQKNMRCHEGALEGAPGRVHLAGARVEFVGEPADPAGTWRVQVVLRDLVRGAEVPVTAVFTLR